jgi:3',5'-cyclic AMP phosphodiesterase CpdA
MKVLILHLSDIHLRGSENSSELKFPFVAKAVQNEEDGIDAITVVITGDLAYSGIAAEYVVADRMLRHLAAELCSRLCVDKVKFVLVPGNHDCALIPTDSVREVVIDGIRKGRPVDDGIVAYCCSVQSAFLALRDTLPGASPDTEYNPVRWDYYITGRDDRQIEFRCYNTAWMSELHEVQGGLHVPENVFHATDENSRAEFVVSVFHHPYNWMPSASYKRFREFVETSSDLILTGHEHEPDHFQKYTLQGEVNDYLEGAVFQEHDRDERSGFHAVFLDLNVQRQRTISFTWDGARFLPERLSDGWVSYVRGARRGKRDFDLTAEFASWLEDPGASYQHPAKADLSLSDIYVFPNLQQVTLDRVESVDSSLVEGRDVLKLLGAKRRVILYGRQQAGKTTLAKVLFVEYYKKNLTPVLLSGDDLTQAHLKLPKLNAFVEAKFQSQYQNPLLPAFQQLDRDKTVILIDDFDHSRLNAKGRLRLVEVLAHRYDHLVIFGDDVLKIEEMVTGKAGSQVLADFDQFEILQFGHLLRSKLIEQWYSLGYEYESDPSMIARRIHEAEQLVTAMLGKNYLPSYPVFVLALIHAHDSTSRPMSTAGTYGSLYEVLITQALTRNARPGDLDLKLTYLSEMAFWMFSDHSTRVSDDEWVLFHARYCTKYGIHPDREVLKRELANQGIFELSNEQYSFRHAASYYYFVARYLRDNLSRDDTRALIVNLLSKLHKEQNASIWLFLTHLSKDPFLIDAILKHATCIYADLAPANFEKDIGFIQKFATNVGKIVFSDRLIEELKEDRLRRLDSMPSSASNDDDTDEVEEETNGALQLVARLNLALRTLEVLGQLVKNFPGSLHGTEKVQLVKECYALGLRTVTMIFDLFQKDVEAFVDLVVDRIIERHPDIEDRTDMSKRVRRYMFWMIEASSVALVKRISRAVGHSQLEQTYRDVRESGDSNAVALIDISVRLDHLGFPERGLEQLKKKFHENFFCTRILRRLVVEHFYLFPTGHETKQKVCQMLDIPMRELRSIDRKAIEHRQVAS